MDLIWEHLEILDIFQKGNYVRTKWRVKKLSVKSGSWRRDRHIERDVSS
jgi:hypothetical protein